MSITTPPTVFHLRFPGSPSSQPSSQSVSYLETLTDTNACLQFDKSYTKFQGIYWRIGSESELTSGSGGVKIHNRPVYQLVGYTCVNPKYMIGTKNEEGTTSESNSDTNLDKLKQLSLSTQSKVTQKKYLLFPVFHKYPTICRYDFLSSKWLFIRDGHVLTVTGSHCSQSGTATGSGPVIEHPLHLMSVNQSHHFDWVFEKRKPLALLSANQVTEFMEEMNQSTSKDSDINNQCQKMVVEGELESDSNSVTASTKNFNNTSNTNSKVQNVNFSGDILDQFILSSSESILGSPTMCLQSKASIPFSTFHESELVGDQAIELGMNTDLREIVVGADKFVDEKQTQSIDLKTQNNQKDVKQKPKAQLNRPDNCTSSSNNITTFLPQVHNLQRLAAELDINEILGMPSTTRSSSLSPPRKPILEMIKLDSLSDLHTDFSCSDWTSIEQVISEVKKMTNSCEDLDGINRNSLYDSDEFREICSLRG